MFIFRLSRNWPEKRNQMPNRTVLFWCVEVEWKTQREWKGPKRRGRDRTKRKRKKSIERMHTVWLLQLQLQRFVNNSGRCVWKLVFHVGVPTKQINPNFQLNWTLIDHMVFIFNHDRCEGFYLGIYLNQKEKKKKYAQVVFFSLSFDFIYKPHDVMKFMNFMTTWTTSWTYIECDVSDKDTNDKDEERWEKKTTYATNESLFCTSS